jgi:hypothetical protein
MLVCADSSLTVDMTHDTHMILAEPLVFACMLQLQHTHPANLALLADSAKQSDPANLAVSAAPLSVSTESALGISKEPY